MPDFEITASDLVKTIHRAEFAPTNLAECGFAGIQGDSLTFTAGHFSSDVADEGAMFAARQGLVDRINAATGGALVGFVPTSRDSVQEYTAGDGTRWARFRRPRFWQHLPVPAEIAAQQPMTFTRLLADTEVLVLASSGAPNAYRLWRLLSGLSAENAHSLLKFGSDEIDLDAVNALFRVFTDGVQPNDTPAIVAAMAAKTVQPAPEPVLSLAGEQGTAAEFAQALQLVRAKNAPPAKETPRGLLCMPEAFDHRLGAWGR